MAARARLEGWREHQDVQARRSVPDLLADRVVIRRDTRSAAPPLPVRRTGDAKSS